MVNNKQVTKKTLKGGMIDPSLMQNFPLIGSVPTKLQLPTIGPKYTHYNNLINNVNKGSVQLKYMKLYGGDALKKKTKTQKKKTSN